MQYIYKTKYALLHHVSHVSNFSNVDEVHVCIMVTLKGELLSLPPSSVGRGSDYESQGCLIVKSIRVKVSYLLK